MRLTVQVSQAQVGGARRWPNVPTPLTRFARMRPLCATSGCVEYMQQCITVVKAGALAKAVS